MFQDLHGFQNHYYCKTSQFAYGRKCKMKNVWTDNLIDDTCSIKYLRQTATRCLCVQEVLVKLGSILLQPVHTN